MSVAVLVVEDEPIAAEAHADYTRRISGFEVAGVAHTAQEAVRLLRDLPRVDLVLLDLHLPDGHGLGLLQRVRAAGHLCDVIAVTSARDADVVRAAVAQGVVLYLIKPFTFAGFRDKLEQYAAYRTQLEGAGTVAQHEVDRMLGQLRPGSGADTLPKGMSTDTLESVLGVLRTAGAPVSASEVAGRSGVSRVTARRYLEHLAEVGQVRRAPRYGRGGRPELEYSWID